MSTEKNSITAMNSVEIKGNVELSAILSNVRGELNVKISGLNGSLVPDKYFQVGIYRADEFDPRNVDTGRQDHCQLWEAVGTNGKNLNGKPGPGWIVGIYYNTVGDKWNFLTYSQPTV